MHLRLVIAPLLALCLVTGASGYSVLTHEAIIDAAWKDNIVPLLMQRFPDSTEDELRNAHGYAYGGAIIQDMGYYPFGSAFFSDLAHYVRSGDFVLNMLSEAGNLNEYAFALGALSHYVADIDGHPAVNQAVAIEYPKLRAKYGNSVRYAQDETAHLKTEFGFDTLQVAKNRYAPAQYHDFIGFQVSEPLLERVFPVVYGLNLTDVLAHEDLAVGSYRFAIGNLIPKLTQVALKMHKKDLIRETPDFAKEKFLYRLSRSDYETEWGNTYERPGVGTRILAALLRIVPTIGPFKGLGFKNPTPKTEDLYITSINKTTDQFQTLLDQAKAGKLALTNNDLDDGNLTARGEYSLADETYAALLAKLSAAKFDQTSAQLRRNILEFYAGTSMPIEAKQDPAQWQTIQANLGQLKAAEPAPALQQNQNR